MDSTGYGGRTRRAMVNTDPSQYPDENPLVVKEGGSSPTPDEVKQYHKPSPYETPMTNLHVPDEKYDRDSRNPYPHPPGDQPATTVSQPQLVWSNALVVVCVPGRRGQYRWAARQLRLRQDQPYQTFHLIGRQPIRKLIPPGSEGAESSRSR